MEKLPEIPGLETTADDESERTGTSKKKKRAEALGAFLVEPKKAAEKKEADEAVEAQAKPDTKAGKGKEDKNDAKDEGVEQAPEQPLESLDEIERQAASEEIVAALEAADEAHAEETPADEAAAAAREAVDHFRARITEDHETVDEAYEATVAEIGIDEADETSEAPFERVAETDEEPIEFSEEPITLSGGAAESPEEIIDEETAALTPPSPPLPPRRVGGGSGGEAGDSGEPPASDREPWRPATGTATYWEPLWHPSSLEPVERTMVVPAEPRTRTEYVPYYNESDITGAALVGGIIGYLIGRRRGRIKTEKKLLPVQKKLEKEVLALRDDIIEKEETIRKTVYQKRSLERQLADRPREIVPGTARIIEQRQSAPEARILHAAPPPPERIGKVVVAAEVPRNAGRTEKAEKVDALKAEAVAREVASLRREDLLQVSETIVVAGSTLRQIYETHLLGEKGLRRLVTEHLQGKDIRKLLRQELIERQIDFERDPMLRDKAHTDTGASSATTPSVTTSVSQLLQKVNNESDQADHERLVQMQKQAEHKAATAARQAQQRHVADITMGVVIGVLLLLVIVLAATHH